MMRKEIKVEKMSEKSSSALFGARISAGVKGQVRNVVIVTK